MCDLNQTHAKVQVLSPLFSFMAELPPKISRTLLTPAQDRAQLAEHSTAFSFTLSIHPFTHDHTHKIALQTYLQHLSRQPNWSLNRQVLGLGTLEQLAADFLERCDFSAGEGDSDLVGFLLREKNQYVLSRYISFVSIFRVCCRTIFCRGGSCAEIEGCLCYILDLHRNPSLASGS